MQDVRAAVKDKLPNIKFKWEKICGEQFIVAQKDDVIQLLKVLRDNKNCKFKQLIDLSAVDNVSGSSRFYLIYSLLSIHLNYRIFIKVFLKDKEDMPSICKLYPCANWYEREVFDMFGINFNNHPDMRRILTDYGFVGHPLRKDFPLTGYLEVRYDIDKEKVIYEPVQLAQDYRRFDFLSPWEGKDNMEAYAKDVMKNVK